MSDLVGNPEDRFSHAAAHLMPASRVQLLIHVVFFCVCTCGYFIHGC